VIGGAVRQRVPVELSADRRFERRIWRLAVVSAIALGLIWGLVVTTLVVPLALAMVFGAGWLLMPSLLVASLVRPRLRYGLVLPASLVSIGLLAVCVGFLPGDPLVAFGWLLMTAGVAVGGGLGLWLWYRLLPVPAPLDDPFSSGRWTLIGVHIALVVAGIALAAQALWE
jgi:hypothetical protein